TQDGRDLGACEAAEDAEVRIDCQRARRPGGVERVALALAVEPDRAKARGVRRLDRHGYRKSIRRRGLREGERYADAIDRRRGDPQPGSAGAAYPLCEEGAERDAGGGRECGLQVAPLRGAEAVRLPEPAHAGGEGIGTDLVAQHDEDESGLVVARRLRRRVGPDGEGGERPVVGGRKDRALSQPCQALVAGGLPAAAFEKR